MRKSKSIIIKSCWLIIFTIICIFLLEANSLSNLRLFFATHISFFQGKRALFSNILIGILGSAVLTLFCEVIEYQSLKKDQHSQIIDICRKWKKNIQRNLPIIFDREQNITLLSDKINSYWNEINSIYTEYVPFFRGGIYTKLIRNLYEFVYTIMEESDSDKDVDILLKEINCKKENLDSVLIYVDVLYLCGMESAVRQEDFLYDLRKIQYLTIKMHQKEKLRRFKEILHIIRHPISTIRIRYLLYKYSKKS